MNISKKRGLLFRQLYSSESVIEGKDGYMKISKDFWNRIKEMPENTYEAKLLIKYQLIEEKEMDDKTIGIKKL